MISGMDQVRIQLSLLIPIAIGEYGNIAKEIS